MRKIKVGIILSGLGYIERGMEVSYLAYVKRFAQNENLDVFVFGAGKDFHIDNITYIKTPCPMRHLFNRYPKIKRLHLTHNHDYENMLYSMLVIPQLLTCDLDVILFSSYPFLLLPLKIYKRFKNKDVKMIFSSGGGTAFLHSRFFFADVVTATDPVSQELFSTKFKSVCISPGIDYHIFRPQNISKTDLNLPENKLVIFSASAFDPIKRLDFLIKAASRMKDVFLVFAGGGSQEVYLKKLGAKLMGQDVRFLGAVDQSILAKYYSVSDVFCLPSQIEPFGNVLAESMACETPVVTNNTAIQKWLVQDGGSCIDIGDADILIETLEKYRNREFAQGVGEKGRQNVLKKFSWDLAAEKYCQLFRELTNF